ARPPRLGGRVSGSGAGRRPIHTLFPYATLCRSPARKKKWSALGEHRDLPTPRYEGLQRWIKGELDEANLRYRTDVPAALAELFRSEEHTSELQSRENLVCRLLLQKKKGDHRPLS